MNCYKVYGLNEVSETEKPNKHFIYHLESILLSPKGGMKTNDSKKMTAAWVKVRIPLQAHTAIVCAMSEMQKDKTLNHHCFKQTGYVIGSYSIKEKFFKEIQN